MIKKIIYALSIIIVYTILSIILWGDHSIVMPLTFVSCFLLAFLIKKTNWIKGKSIFFYYLPMLSIFTLFAIISIVGVCRGQIVLSYSFCYLIFIPLFFFLGSLLQKTKKYVVIVMAIPLILYFNHAYIFPNSFSLFSNNAVSINKALPGFNLLDKNKVPIELPKNKVVVLDFWSTYCGVCYLKFPIFESVYQRYKDNPNVVFYGVHVSYKEDKFEDVIHLLDKYEYSFPLLYAIDKKEINSKLDVKLFPTILLIKNNEIRYKGALIVDEKIVFGNTINQIEELLNE